MTKTMILSNTVIWCEKKNFVVAAFTLLPLQSS